MRIAVRILTYVFAVQMTFAGPVPQSEANTSSSSAGATIFADKRFKLFKQLSNATYEILRIYLIEGSKIYENILRDYNDWLLVHNNTKHINVEAYHSLKQDMTQLLADVKLLEKNQTNCKLQRKAQDETFDVEMKYLQLRNADLIQIWTKHNKQNSSKKVKMDQIMDNYYEDVATSVEEFMKNLSETEKKDNKELINRCEKFIAAKSQKEKSEALNALRNLFEHDMINEINSTDPDCKISAQIEFIQQSIFLALMTIFSSFT